MKYSVVCYVSLLFVGSFALDGCHVQSYSFDANVSAVTNGPNAGQVSVGVSGGVTVVSNIVVGGVVADDIVQLPTTGFVISASVPSSTFSIDTSKTPYATLTATTDTGFTSSVTVPLQLVGAAINPINAGDAVTSYSLSETSQLDVWAQTVAQNTQSGTTIHATAYEPFIASQASGTYTLSSQVTNSVTAASGVSSTQVSLSAPPPPACGAGHTKCYAQ